MTVSNLLLRVVAVCCLSLLAIPAAAQRAFDKDILSETFGFDENTKAAVSLEDLHQGCPARDCIPSIDDPKYVGAGEADHVSDDDIVLALSWKGYHRAWPARILDQHEIVNDIIGGTPMAITWCPLCGSAVAVVREFNGQITEFGVSGVLYNSDLVFYDRATETLWDQVIAKGIVGPLTGTELELIPITMTRWGKWRDAHPDTLVLSTDTGFMKDYSRDAYGKYRDSSSLMFPVSKSSDAMHPKAVVFGFDFGSEKIAFADTLLQDKRNIDHEFNGKSVSVNLADDGIVTMTDKASGEIYTPVRLYWFAWFTFHPETDLVR